MCSVARVECDMFHTFFSSASGQNKFVLEIIVFCNMQNEKVFLIICSYLSNPKLGLNKVG